MYEPYPSSGSLGASGAGLTPEPVQQPRSVRTAVRLMYLAAGLEAVAFVVALLTRGSLRAAILRRHPHYTATQLHHAENAQTVILVVGALIAVALWLWMAWANGRGHNWARVVAAVLFGISTLSLLVSFAAERGVGDRIIGIVLWLIGLAVIVLLFRKESAPFFARSAPPG
jgi:hypothetical protein